VEEAIFPRAVQRRRGENRPDGLPALPRIGRVDGFNVATAEAFYLAGRLNLGARRGVARRQVRAVAIPGTHLRNPGLRRSYHP